VGVFLKVRCCRGGAVKVGNLKGLNVISATSATY